MGVLTVTLNAAIDATYVVEGFAHGGVNRVLRQHRMPGGKGNNVARVLASLGVPVVATGFLAGDAGCFIAAGLQRRGITTRFRRLAEGESRTCHTVLERDTGVATEILEAGPTLDQADLDSLLESLEVLLDGAGVVVVSGSAPPGATPAFLERIARLVRMRTRRFAVDSSGPALHALLTGQPVLLKPNEAEIQHLMGRPAPLDDQVAFIRHDLIGSRLGPDAKVILSRGRDGANLVTAATVLRARPPAIEAVNTVGCGDALLAGFVAAWEAGDGDADALRAGVAAGTAAAMEEVAGLVDPLEVARLRPLVEVTEDEVET